MAKIAFTAGRVSGFKCPPDKKQTFLWDAIAPGLGLRATPAGKPAYVFQSVYQGKDIRITIGSPAAWSIPEAQAKARELQRLIDEGKDPRDLKRDALPPRPKNKPLPLPRWKPTRPPPSPWEICGRCTWRMANPSARMPGSRVTVPTLWQWPYPVVKRKSEGRGSHGRGPCIRYWRCRWPG